jgi:hypothetical protein
MGKDGKVPNKTHLHLLCTWEIMESDVQRQSSREGLRAIAPLPSAMLSDGIASD